LFFNDKSKEHIQHLEKEIEQNKCEHNCCVNRFTSVPFKDALSSYQTNIQDSDSASLVIMDQFGIKEITPEVINFLSDCKKTDVLFFSFLIRICGLVFR
jgi:hypothetical protein